MAMKFTEDQQRVIDIRDCNVLVSAAAGSGKTAVLVERILSLITDPENPVDIDRLLVVTFTNAAAAEMRERIHSAILDRMEQEPDHVNLQRQAVLVHHAQITTIDSFCRFILKNHFQEIDLDPGFTVGDPGKMRLMEKEAMGAVMEEAYAGKEYYEGFYADFIRLTDVFASKGRDTAVEEMTDKLYHFVMSLPFPEKWLKDTLQDYETGDSEAFFHCKFMEKIMTDASQKLKGMVSLYDRMLAICMQADGPENYITLLEREREEIAEGIDAADYAALKDAVCAVSFERLPVIRKGNCNEDKKEQVKQIRDRLKKRLAALKEQYFFESPEDMQADMQTAGTLLKPLVYLTFAFMERFAADKAKENVIDFSDMEHFALKILVDEDGKPTDTAKQYQEYYAQIMIDEYQDSNEVQELLLSVISKEDREKPNRFMVGDMKQSIYKFRMARPEIFLEKYEHYSTDGGRKTRIDLKKNFRSRQEVIDTVNHIFYPLMGKEVGGIIYDDASALYAGAEFPQTEAGTELLIFEKNNGDGEKSGFDGNEAEALMIAGRIKELLQNGRVTDKETGELRPVTYEDIVILVRSTTGLMESIQEVFKKEGIPVSVPSRTGYFSALEVQTMLQLLEVLVNPGRDIPLAAVLKSPLYGFTDEELAQISMTQLSGEEGGSFYEKLKLSETEKTGRFLEELEKYRETAKTETVHDLLYRIIREHRYLEYVAALPGGGIRRANVEMLLEKAVDYEKLQMHGLFGFLQYMKQLEKYEVDYGEGMDENGDCVRLMTIHKSKGLEFPICFVAGLSKRFNRRDLSGALLLHTDMGIGMEYRDAKIRVKRKTLKQKIVAEQMKTEELGEELRVLYVALTRAREKLILTGVSDNFADALAECRNLNAGQYLAEPSERKVEPELILESNSYLKLLLHVLSLYDDVPEYLPMIRIYHEADLETGRIREQFERGMQKETLLRTLSAMDGETDEKSVRAGEELQQKINFAYPHPELEGLYTKTSVSELKLAALHEDEQTEVLFETEQEETVVPLFMKDEKKVGGAARGTAYHRLMELIDFKRFAEATTGEERHGLLSRQIDDILQKGRMEAADMDLIDPDKVEAFLDSDLAREMSAADREGKLFKEQPFVMSIPAKRINEKFPEYETMLIQGIIDAYYEKQGQIYLMDYKTDRVNKKEDLIQRYQTQLDYYKEALEKLTGKKVAGIYIYSYHFLASIAI
ncbi:MAG: helicase-exonuclease AddAB subunit AddA [Lachnospiraceae bacterium]